MLMRYAWLRRGGRLLYAAAGLVCLCAWLARASYAAEAPAEGGMPEPVPAVPEEEPAAPEAGEISLTVALELENKADLTADEVKFAGFPLGRESAFTYSGTQYPEMIKFYQGLGFRTTVGVGPRTSPKNIADLEAAGAEVGVEGLWGGKGTYISCIGANTYQEAYDAAVTTRMVLEKKAKSPVHLMNASSSKAGSAFWYDRQMDCGLRGYGHVFQDSNYMVNWGWAEGYPTLVGRGRTAKIRIMEPAYSMGGLVSNELIYYQSLSNQIRGTLRREDQGKIVRFPLPKELEEKDRALFTRIIGQYGKDPKIWHATVGEITGLAYLKKNVRLAGVKATGDKTVELSLALDPDVYAPFLLAPLPLQLPDDFPLKGAAINGTPCTVTRIEDHVFLDVPVQAALRNGAAMSLATAMPDMAIPEEMPLTLTLRNTSDKPWKDARLTWLCVGHPHMTVTGGTDAAFDLAAGAETKIAATARTERGAYFGLRAIGALVTAKIDGAERKFLEGFEIVVAPRIRLEMFPSQRFPMTKDRVQPILIYLSNGRSSQPGGPPDKFISSRAGPCKGVVSFDLPPGMEAIPREQAFDLPEDSSTRLVFRIKNNEWGKEFVTVRPLVKFAGEDAFLETVHPGVHVIRDKDILYYEPIDDKGLTLYANWDDPDKWKNLASNPRNARGVSGISFYHEGVKGYCSNWESMRFFDPFKTVDYQHGTILFWMKRDPAKRNENQYRPDPAKTWMMPLGTGYGPGELICGDEDSGQPHDLAKSGVGIRRWPGWGGKDGYLEAVYISMPNQRHYVQVPYANDRLWEWRHVGLLWDMNARRLELYLDGQLAGKADPGKEEWYGSPWDRGGPGGGTNGGLSFGSCDHGKVILTLRDEVYIYNRTLTPAEIKQNMLLARKASDSNQ